MSAYGRMVRNLERADAYGRGLMLTMARGSGGFTALTIFCAANGYTREGAASAIGCEAADLDTAIEGITATVRADRMRREERAS